MDSTSTNSANSSSLTPNSSIPKSSPSLTSKNSTSSSSNESFDETPLRKFRSLQEIYESCSFALVVSNPITYEEVAKMEEGHNVMKEEMMAIQRNETWEMINFPNGKKCSWLEVDIQNKVLCRWKCIKAQGETCSKGIFTTTRC